MVVKNKKDGNKIVISVEGRVDSNTAPELEKNINELISDSSEVEIDCAKLDYISSAGLRVLLSVHKKLAAAGKLTIINVNDVVSEVFELTGFSTILNIVK